jgi:general nucleoside transport system permease protein
MQNELSTPKPTIWQRIPSLSLPLRWLGLILGPLVIFGLFLLAVGANPIQTYRTMLYSALGDYNALSEVLIRAAPIILTALATAVPARVRLVNVGAEGQLAIGALFAASAAVIIGDALPGVVILPILIVAGAIGGAVWAGISGFLRVKFQLNETISSLLLNYVAFLTVGYFVHGLLKDPNSFNWPFSPPLADAARFATIGGTRLHWGVILAPLAAALIWYLFTKTFWGLHLRVVGGNPLAARRAGLNVERMQLLMFLLAGALAGLAGVIEVAGVEGRLRPTTGVGLGYVGFLAAWMVSHNPLWLIGSSLLLAIIAVSGDALQMTASLPASSVNILMALVLLGVLARFNFSFKKKEG